MPQYASDAFIHQPDALKIEWRGIDTLFDYLAVKKIKSEIDQRQKKEQ
jgi:hypothetical protein